MVILGDREFHGIELSYWLKQKNKKAKNSIYFAFREKNNIYLKRSKKNQKRLKDLKLIPGIKVLHKNVQLTKQKGFGRFNLLAYKKRSYRHHKVKESWFIITNLDSADEVIKLYKKRAGIEVRNALPLSSLNAFKLGRQPCFVIIKVEVITLKVAKPIF